MNKTLFIIIGYAVFTFYTLGIMCFGILLEKRTKIDKLICRKITHIVSALIWIICYYFFGFSIHWIILNAVGAILLGLTTLSPKFKAFGRDDSDKSAGMFYFALSTLIVAVICFIVGEELYLYTGIAYYCLALGDGFAPIVAKLCKRNPQITQGKTLFGTLSVFVVSFLSTLIFSSVFKMNLDFPFILSVAALTCVVEFYGYKGTDNLFIEFIVFGYLVLNHYRLNTEPLKWVIIASPILACAVIGKNKMTKGGGVAALAVFLTIGYFGKSFASIIFITGLFFAEGICSVICNYIAKKNGLPVVKEPRTFKQILAVGFIGCIFLIIGYFTGKKVFYNLFALSFIGQFVDSIASDVGRLTHGKTVSIIAFKEVEKGVSGGVSWLGTTAAFLSAFLLTLLLAVNSRLTVQTYLALALFAFAECLIDSVLGQTVQASYRCVACGKQTENAEHCGEHATIVKGFRLIDNSMVNLLSGIIICAIAFFAFKGIL